MGNRGIEFYIHKDGSMFMPAYQVVYTEDISSYAEQYTQYDWSEGYQFFVFGMDVDEDGNPIDDTENEDGQAGTVDANGIYWPVSAIYDLIGANGNWYFGVGFYPFINNKLTFTDDSTFEFPEDFMRGDVDMDGSVGIADVTALIDYILTQNETGISVAAADCDMDESVGIADVTALIDFILTGVWN